MKTDAEEWADLVDDRENGPIQNPLGVPMAPDQNRDMLVRAAREAVKNADDPAALKASLEKLAAVLKMFEDVK